MAKPDFESGEVRESSERMIGAGIYGDMENGA